MQFKIYYDKKFYLFTIDEKDENTFIFEFRLSRTPEKFMHNLKLKNVKYILETEVIQWKTAITLFFQFIAKMINF